MKKASAMVCMFFLALLRLSAQEAGGVTAAGAADAAARAQAAEDAQRLRLATSSIDYPATPGDVYQLTYRQTDTMITMVPVESDYTLDLQIFGRMSAAGLSFAQLKQTVEAHVTAGYPRSLPSLTIVSVGVFRVHVRGELPQARYVTAWGLSRLSEVIEGVRGQYSSIRNVTIVSQSGESKRYDLMDALRFGQPAQDPFVRSGDTIVLSRADRIVEISGEVFQPGRYELEPGEGLKELVNRYGGGTTSAADLTRVRIDRVAGDRARTEYVDLPGGFNTNGRLLDGDRVMVASKAERLPSVSFEGAVIPATPAAVAPTAAAAGGTAAAQETAVGGSQTRLLYPFREGETLGAAFQAIRGSIASFADVSLATLIRQGSAEIRTVDLQLLGQSAATPDILLQPNDRIIIPTIRLYVSVQGAVFAPASYPYQAGYSANAYISLAGGIDPERNGNGNFTLSDSQGNAKKKTDAVMPGDKIYVPNNQFGFVMNRFVPLFSSIIAVIVTTMTFVITMTQFIQTAP